MPVMIFTAVDLPAPFSPTSATTCPAASCSSTPSSARTPSKCFLMPSRARTGVSAGGDIAMATLEELRKLVDVALVEHVGLGHRGVAVRVDLQRPHAAHGYLGVRLAGRLIDQQRVCSIDGRVAEIDRIPDRERVDRARVNVAGHLGRQAEAGDEHLAHQALIGDRLGRCGDPDGRGRDDGLQRRVLAKQSHRLAVALVRLIVTVHDVHQLEPRELGLLQVVFHDLDPLVLVRGLGGCTQDGNLAFAADRLGGHLQLLGADELGVGRFDLDHPAGLGDARIERQHGDAARRGITVLSFDSGVAKAGRVVQIKPSNPELIGPKQLQMAAKTIGGKGEIAILSATAQATNQNKWIQVMKDDLKKPEFAGLKLVDVVYGDDQSDKSYREAVGLFRKHPALKAIIAPTTVGITASAKAVTDQSLVGKVFVTGLGLPSEMAGHVHSGAVATFAIWNPIDLGYTAVYAAHSLLVKKASGKPNTEVPVGRMGSLKIDANGDAAMSEPYVFDKGNVDKFAKFF